MSKKLILYGASNYGYEVADQIHDINDLSKEWEIIGFLDDNPIMQGKDLHGIPVLGNKSWLDENNINEYYFLCCIGKPSVKRKIISVLDAKGVKYATIIHPTAIISSKAYIGKGCIIMAGNIVSTLAKVEDHVIINIGGTVGHNTIINNYCCINPGVNISGDVTVNEGVLVGTNATILEKLKIGADSVVSAAAMVYTDVPEKVTVMGVPARVINKL